MYIATCYFCSSEQEKMRFVTWETWGLGSLENPAPEIMMSKEKLGYPESSPTEKEWL